MIDTPDLFKNVKFLFVNKTGTQWITADALRVYSTRSGAITVNRLIKEGMVDREKPKSKLFSTFALTEKGQEFFSILLL